MIELRSSPIAGQGLFATQTIQPKQFIFQLTGPTIQYPTEPDWKTRPNALQICKHSWKLPLSGNPWRYINHSCAPNAGMRGRAQVIAMRTILPGEEVTIDYSTIESGRNWHLRCRCGAPECRTTIRGAQYMSTELFSRYEQYMPAYFRQVYQQQKTYTAAISEPRGLYAKHNLKKGEPIFKVEGPTVSYQFAPDWRVGYVWLMTGKNTWIIPQKNNPWWSIKHSCLPNVGLVRKNTVVALRNISADEELAIDDSITEADPKWHRACDCGAVGCRGIIKSVQFLPQELFVAYQPFIPTFQKNMYLKAQRISRRTHF